MAAGTLFVGDVHGCSVELAELLHRADAARVVLLGDLFTKGPDPMGVWALIQAHRCEAVLGNHDAAVLSRVGTAQALDLPDDCIAWLRARPLFIEGEGPKGPWLAVHAGVHPKKGRSATRRAQALNLRRWPDDRDPDNAFWWERHKGPPLVIYGHDAMRGLVDRRPHSLGLDTGCVYGGRLTAFLLEQDRLLQATARRVYKPVGRR
ncbi:MAG: metallophosphoesterase [Alphaproteobacteria bacterium]|nr:metallophosphoesterase [Alphaproteobacteria bacterium]